MIPRIHRWRVPFEYAAPPRSTSHSPLPHHQADPACESQFLVNLRIILARNVRYAYKCVVLPDTIASAAGGSFRWSQCTYRCVVLPDFFDRNRGGGVRRLNAPTGAWCSLTRLICPSRRRRCGLNAPTGAWCSLTVEMAAREEQKFVSMHLQVRGAP